MKKLDELRKLIEENGSVSKFLGLMLDSESTYFVKFSGATQDPLKSLIVETIHDAGVRPDLTADEKELISGVILETADETIMKMAKNQGTVRRSNRFFKELYAKMNDSDQFSAIVASYMQDTMMDDLAKETSDGNLLAAIAMWIVCRSVLIPIVPIGETSQEVHVEQEKPVEEKKETSGTVIDAEVVDGRVVEVPLLTEEETKKEEKVEEVKSETKSEPVKEEGLESIIQKFASGLLHELESSGKVVDMGTITSSLETILKATTSTGEKKEGGTVTTSASTAYKDETEASPKTENIASDLIKLKKMGRMGDEYKKLSGKLIKSVKTAMDNYGENATSDMTEAMVRLLVSVIDSMNVLDDIVGYMSGKINEFQFSHILKSYVADYETSRNYRHYGISEKEMAYVSRDVVAYEFLKQNPGFNGVPSIEMVDSINPDKINGVSAFKYLMLNFKSENVNKTFKSMKRSDVEILSKIVEGYDDTKKVIELAETFGWRDIVIDVAA